MNEFDSNDAIACDISDLKTLYSVAQINRLSRELLESQLSNICVEGEISNLAQPKSGHLYFSLKDSHAQLRCAMFKRQGKRLTFQPKHGMQVIATGSISLYEARGDYQLIVDEIEEAGLGDLQKAFETLKKQLQSAGLFQQAHKKKLPKFPQCVGIITSPTGAAIQDILQVSQRRFPTIPIIVYPCAVQGSQAKHDITKAIEIANRHQHCDVLIIGRGGGSLEDLWAFNEACVAQAIFDSHIPCVAAVGHEIDFTITDFVADVRAPTPSAAAELVFPDAPVIAKQIEQTVIQLYSMMKRHLVSQHQQLELLKARVKHPKQVLRESMQHIDNLEIRLLQLIQKKISSHQQHWHTYNTELRQLSPSNRLKQLNHQLAYLFERLQRGFDQQLNNHHQRLQHYKQSLTAYSPEATLSRGYSIISHNDRVITQANQLQSGDKITAIWHKGKVNATVD